MNRDSLLKGIFWVALATSFAGLIISGYVIYTRQVDKIELLKENLKETHQTLKEAKDRLEELKNNTDILTETKNNLSQKVSLQENRIEQFEQETEKLQDKTKYLSTQKGELEEALKITRESLEAAIKTQKDTIAKLEEDYQKKSAMEKALFLEQEKKSNEQVEAAEVLLEVLTARNKELGSKSSENKQLLVRLIEEREDEGEPKTIADKRQQADNAVNEAKLREKINSLNSMIEQNKKLITKNEKVIIDVTNEKEKIADKLEQTKGQFSKEALKLHYNLGLAYDESRQYDEAIAEYEKAFAIDDSDPDLHYNMAIIYEGHFHDMRKALMHYEAYLKLSPNAEDADKVAYWIEKAKEELKYSAKKLRGSQSFYDIIMKDKDKEDK